MSRPRTTPAGSVRTGVPGLPASSLQRSRPISGAAASNSSSRSSSRPLSSSNVTVSVANARFKNFQVQYEILCRNPILAAIAQEIPWKNLFDLFLLKFYAVGDELWAQGEQPHELAFILCGGFLTRRVEENPQPPADGEEGPKVHVLAEKMVKPGRSLAAFAVLRGTHLPYAVITARFKSILLSLPAQRLKSIMRQLTTPTREIVEHLIGETEQKLMESLGLPFRMRRTPHNSIAPTKNQPGARQQQSYTRSAAKKRVPASLFDHIMGFSEKQKPSASVKRSASASAVGNGTPSWASLHVAKPMEYEVNSSLLILHQSSSTDQLHLPSSTSSKSAQVAQSSNISAVASQIAKKHTQRRLESIKLPTPAEAFPPRRLSLQQRLQENGEEAQDIVGLVEKLLGQQLTKHSIADVVPKERVGRLLKPLKKPAMISAAAHIACPGSRQGRRVLVANRCEPFRDASQDIFEV
ncbi:hypothetical protein BBJ28_00001319 [Nothophytophthora sp. Chile5]|nr:hypothetical protein BBJ28_00001319 [Nothophytophthora sp. Chile5]